MQKISFLMVFILLLGWPGSAWADLVGYWLLDGDATDLSGNGNHGIISGSVAPIADRFGNPSGAMSFAGGSGDKIDLGDPLEFNLTGAMTITAWIYLDSTSPVHGAKNSRLLAKMGGGGSRSWSSNIEMNVAGVPFPATFQVSSDGGDVIGLSDNSTLPLDQWVHYAGVYTPGTSLEVYLNGDLSDIRTTDIPVSQFSNNSRVVLIGNRPDCGNCGWYGALDEVRIYNEALSEAEIEAIMGGEFINRKPSVDAGAGSVLIWPNNTYVLDATVTDDGLGDPNGFIGYEWSTLPGPGNVTFEPNAFVEDPTATFPTIGQYTLVLTATDGELDGNDTVTIRVVEPFCPVGDLNGNCKVNLEDIVIMGGVWLLDDDTANIDHKNKVDMVDFSLLAQNWLVEKSLLPLVINEVLARNFTIEPPDPQGEYDDWIEIYNYGDDPIDIGGMYLTDDLDRATMWQIPANLPQNTTIDGHGYLIVWADGDINDSGLHANFRINADNGDEIGLFDVNGSTLIDSIEFGEQYPDVSYGREPDAGETWLTLDPSPGASNNDRFLGVVAETKFYPEHGFFDTPFEVTISTETPDTTIYFTTDGSDPIASDGTPGPTAQIYDQQTNQPNIATTTCLRAAAVHGPGWKPSYIVTQTYIFLDDVLTQTRPAGYPTTWSYDMDSTVVNHSNYTGRIRDDMKSIPTLSIVAGRDAIFGAGGVIGSASGSIEIPASVELIHSDGRDGFQVNCGVTSHGRGVSQKRSLRLYFRSKYGQSKLRYPLFDDMPEYDGNAADQFDRLILRAGGNDQLRANSAGRQVSRTPQGVKATYLADQLARDSQIAVTGYGSHGSFVHLYLNGLYWGLYNIVEKPDAFFTSTYYGGEREDWFATKMADNTRTLFGDPISGDDTRFNYMHNNRWNWNVVKEYLDVGHYCDYILYYLYSGAGDWPDNNWYAGNRNTPVPGKVKYFIWDAELSWLHTWKNDGHSYHVCNEGAWIHPVLLERGGFTNGYDLVSKLWRELHDNSDFMTQFADNLYEHCYHDGQLTEESIKRRFDDLCAVIDGAVVGESARWGRFRASPGLYTHGPLPVWTREDWRWYADYMRSLMDGNIDQLLAALRDTTMAGPEIVDHPLYYPTIDPPEFYINGVPMHGGYISDGDMLSMTNPNGAGTIYYTANNADPRLSGGAVNVPDAVAYSAVVPLHRTVRIKARVLNGGEWSALNEAIYALPIVAQKLRITELMYHPANPPQGSGYNDEDFEFIELKHIYDPDDPTEVPINLNLVSFTNGIEYTFDSSVVIDPNEYVIVVKNPTAFATRYDTIGMNIAPGEYTGSLSNGGEEIDLDDALGTEIHDFNYSDGWYEITDGLGFSLTIRDPNSTDPNDWDRKSGWRASFANGGSPGADDSSFVLPDDAVIVNELLAHADMLEPNDWVEFYNTTDDPINIGGWFISDNDNDLMKYEIEESLIIPSHGYAVFYADPNFGPGSADPGSHTSFAFSESGEKVYLTSGSGGALTGVYSTERKFDPSEADVAFGHYVKSTGGNDFVAMSSNTPGWLNASPKIGSVVITEIAYHPRTEKDAEYVELLNISGAPVTLYDSVKGVPWRFVDDPDDPGVEFSFPSGSPITLADGEYLLLVNDLVKYNQVYPSPPGGVTVLEWGGGNLNNGGEKLELQTPGDLEDMERMYIRVDRVTYDNKAPWPTAPDGPDGDGSDDDVLERIDENQYGNDVINWQAASPTPGTINPNP